MKPARRSGGVQKPLAATSKDCCSKKASTLPGFQLVKDLLVVHCPTIQSFRQCDALCWLLWENAISSGKTHCRESFHQAVGESCVSP
jgi:hypothetical protein